MFVAATIFPTTPFIFGEHPDPDDQFAVFISTGYKTALICLAVELAANAVCALVLVVLGLTAFCIVIREM